jgi:hypothetical protein
MKYDAVRASVFLSFLVGKKMKENGNSTVLKKAMNEKSNTQTMGRGRIQTRITTLQYAVLCVRRRRNYL